MPLYRPFRKRTPTALEDKPIIRTISIPLSLYGVAQRYHVSLTDAAREGILMMLNDRPDFLKSDEEDFKKYGERGMYVEKVRRMAQIIAKLTEEAQKNAEKKM